MQCIDQGESDTKILDASNRFYTLIPHDFGMKAPPLLNNTDMIKVIFYVVFINDLKLILSLLHCAVHSTACS